MPHEEAPLSASKMPVSPEGETDNLSLGRGPNLRFGERGPISSTARLAIIAYRYTLSPFLHLCGVRCRHEPTCSAYGLEAFAKHPPHKAAALTGKRILNCRPGGTWGYDPVPEKR